MKTYHHIEISFSVFRVFFLFALSLGRFQLHIFKRPGGMHDTIRIVSLPHFRMKGRYDLEEFIPVLRPFLDLLLHFF